MQKKGTEVIGDWNCPICGKAAHVKRSLRGRLSMVCKWQDGGCGSQLQTLTADASMMMMKRIHLIDVAGDQPEGLAKDVSESMKDEKSKPRKAPSVNESGWGIL